MQAITRITSYSFIISIILIYPLYSLFSFFGLLPIIPYNLINIAIGLFCLILIISNTGKNIFIINKITFIVFILFTIISLYIFINYDLYSYTEDHRYINAIRYYIPFIAMNFICYSVFKYIYKFTHQKSNLFRNLFIIYCILFFIFYWEFFSFSLLKVDYSRLLKAYYIGIYQLVSDSFAFCVLILLSKKENNALKYGIILFLTMFILFTLNSRASFFTFILAIVSSSVIEIILNKNIKKLYNIVYLILLIIIISFILNITLSYSIIEILMTYNHRMYNILTGNFSADPSFQGRTLLFSHSLQTIYDYPVLGNFGGQATNNIDGFGTRWGGYTHSILAYWDQFGIFAFILMLYLISYLLRSGYLIFKTNNIFYFPAILYVVIEQLFMKSFNYYLIFIMIGIIQGTKYANKHNYNN